MEGSRSLGIDFRQGKDRESAGGPSAEASQALSRAGAGSWVDAQIQDESAETAEPPAALREYLEQNRDALWTLVSAVEKDEPDWGPDEPFDGELRTPFLPVLRLVRVLVALALVEEREGRSIEAGRALEAAWTLGRSVSKQDGLLPHLIGIGAERMQVGALRKMSAPPLQWLGRLSSDGPWPRIGEAVRAEGSLHPRRNVDSVRDEFSEVKTRMYLALADSLEKRSPCDPDLGSDHEIWRPATEALAAETNTTKRLIRDFYAENMGETIAGFVRRSARFEVDREMTLKILQLRLEKDSSPAGRWPGKLVDPTSAVCAEASYSYETSGTAATLRFVGSVETPEGGPVLPLVFRAASRSPTPAAGESPSE